MQKKVAKKVAKNVTKTKKKDGSDSPPWPEAQPVTSDNVLAPQRLISNQEFWEARARLDSNEDFRTVQLFESQQPQYPWYHCKIDGPLYWHSTQQVVDQIESHNSLIKNYQGYISMLELSKKKYQLQLEHKTEPLLKG